MKWIIRILAAIVVLAVAAGVGLYLTATRTPEGYAPSELSPEQEKQAAQQFVRDAVDLFNKAPTAEPLVWTGTEERINRYLAAMDEIAFYRQGGRRGEVRSALDRVGLSDPAVRLREGGLTLMARSEEYGAVLSVDVRLDMTEDSRLQVAVTGVRVGALPLPESAYRQRIEALQETVRANGLPASAAPTDRLLGVFGRIVRAIGGEPIRVEQEMNHRLVTLHAVQITPEAISLRFADSAAP